MGFMDSVTSFTKGVGAKAKGNYDVVSLNSQISTIQREITGLYTKIGERYYEVHKDSPEECFDGMIREVNDRVAKISALQREIENTKEAMAAVTFTNPQAAVRYCTKCGTPLEVGNVFCVRCGAKQADYTQPAPAAEGGVYADEPAAPMQETSVDATPVQEMVEPASPVICPVCGVELRPGSSFCTSCGTKIES